MKRSFLPSDPKARLPRDRLALALAGAGYPTSAAMLSFLAVSGRGPKFKLEQAGGRGPWKATYVWSDAIAWARKERKRVAPSDAAA